MLKVTQLEKHQSWDSDPDVSGPKSALLSPHQVTRQLPFSWHNPASALGGCPEQKTPLRLPREKRERGQGAEGACGWAGPAIPEEDGIQGVGGRGGQLTSEVAVPL